MGRKRTVSRAPKNLNFPPIGRTQACNHRYQETISINATVDGGTALCGDHIFAATGMTDPNLTGVGHQPYGMDQMDLFYIQYSVTGSRITVKTAGGQSVPYYIGVCLRDNATPLTIDPSMMLESPDVKWKLIQLTAGPGTVRLGCSTRKFFTVRDVVGSYDYGGSSAGNPSSMAYFHVLICPMDNTTDLAAQSIGVTIDYHAVWTRPRQLGQS